MQTQPAAVVIRVTPVVNKAKNVAGRNRVTIRTLKSVVQEIFLAITEERAVERIVVRQVKNVAETNVTIQTVNIVVRTPLPDMISCAMRGMSAVLAFVVLPIKNVMVLFATPS